MEVAVWLDCGMLRLVEERKFYSAADMAQMTPQERADVVAAATCHSWDEVPEPFRSEVLATARELGQRFRHDE